MNWQDDIMFMAAQFRERLKNTELASSSIDDDDGA